MGTCWASEVELIRLLTRMTESGISDTMATDTSVALCETLSCLENTPGGGWGGDESPETRAEQVDISQPGLCQAGAWM